VNFRKAAADQNNPPITKIITVFVPLRVNAARKKQRNAFTTANIPRAKDLLSGDFASSCSAIKRLLVRTTP
jgi:hypothetical protein